MLDRLFANAGRGGVLLLGPAELVPANPRRVEGQSALETILLAPKPQCSPGRGWVPRIVRALIGPIQFATRVTQLKRLLRERRCLALVACSGPWSELPMCWLAARWAGVGFVPYIFDWYGRRFDSSPGVRGKLVQWLARRLEGPLLRRADAVIVPNELLQDEYLRRYGVATAVVHNPHGWGKPVYRGTGAWPGEPGVVRICLTGAIYEAHFDAVRNVIEAARQIEEAQVRLEAYTDLRPDELEHVTGNSKHCLIRPRVGVQEIMEIQTAADILLLPLAFDSLYPDIVRTSAPAKFGDYLASGRPLLVHAPADSFVAQYCRRFECGLTVETNDPRAVREAIQLLINDVKRREVLQRNALARAEADFSLPVARRRLAEVFRGLGYAEASLNRKAA